MPTQSTTSVVIPESVLLRFVERCLNFPYAQICVHSVALDLLGMAEQCGYTLDREMIGCICAGQPGEEKALKLISDRLKVLKLNTDTGDLCNSDDDKEIA